MRQEEEQVKVRLRVEDVVVVDDIDQIEGEPTDPENGDHRDQHPVGPLLLLLVGLLAARALRARLGLGALVQPARYPPVAVPDDAEGDDELHDEGEQAKRDLQVLVRPVLLADDAPGLGPHLLHAHPVRQGDQHGEHPDAQKDQQAGVQLHALPEGVQDHEEAIDGDRRQGQGRDVDARRLSVAHQMTGQASEYPFPQEGVQRGEGDAQDAQQNVGQRQVRYEQVRHRLHGLVRVDDVADEDVAEQAEQKDHRVQDVEDYLD